MSNSYPLPDRVCGQQPLRLHEPNVIVEARASPHVSSNSLLGSFRGLPISRCKARGSEEPFAAHYVKDIYAITIDPIENATGRFNYLPIAPPLKFRWP